MSSLLIRNAILVNEGDTFEADVVVKNGLIDYIGRNLNPVVEQTVDARGLYLLPGVIDDQVHFREPGLTHKADLQTESRAAVAGGITSYMEMPNTKPQALTQELLEDKYRRAAEVSAANYSFFMGASNDNLEEVLKTDPKQVCGVKVFMGSSTGDMLVDDEAVLEKIFANAPTLVATHCEKEEIIRANTADFLERFGDDIPLQYHPVIRSREACYASSSQAVALAKKHGTRLHILHISTAEETELFTNEIPLQEKKITAEACIHHLWFTDEDYQKKGAFIKWNPAVKETRDREAIRQALIDGRIDVVATDHAPHTLAEKDNLYPNCPSGAPMVQHALPAMLEMHLQGLWDLPFVVEKMSHNVARLFDIDRRGFIREGYHADLVLVSLDQPWTVTRGDLLYKCGWSPMEGQTFRSRVLKTWVNGQLAYNEGQVDPDVRGDRLVFNRN